MKNSQIHLVIHGHFYQPPRESPWTLEIEKQFGADPYHDWNEKINAECYAANTRSRYLDEYGHIRKIINNYEYISFNFGPTLLTWMEKADPATYHAIIQADKTSITKHQGHGNAIAQVYNHMIMPLCNEKDMITQIEWGLVDFEKRFGRKSEGIWLAETACNNATLDALISFGIKFVILSPFQIDKVRSKEDRRWTDVSEGSVDTSQAYAIITPKGSIDCFPYNAPLSQAVSFEHILRDANTFKEKILSEANEVRENPIIPIVTDGESYGHHEPFGDMALAALIVNNELNQSFTFTNFSEYLALNPPTSECQIKPGKDNLGTAWSCSHGVGRWMENCGCQTGGPDTWKQHWRKPLREAFNVLRDEIAIRFEKECAPLLGDVWKARNKYIHALFCSSEDDIHSYINSIALRDLMIEERRLVLRFLESQKYAMFMYTSCAWFFTEISGIETVQCLKYAAKAIDLIEEYIDKNVINHFLELLKQAASNIVQYQDGLWIYQNFVQKYKFTVEHHLNQWLIYNFLMQKKLESMYFNRITYTNSNEFEKEGIQYAHGTVSFKNQNSLEESSFLFYIIYESTVKIKVYIKKYSDANLVSYLDNIFLNESFVKIKESFKEWFIRHFSLKDLNFDYREKLLAFVFQNHFNRLKQSKEADLEDYLMLLSHYKDYEVAIPLYERSLFISYFNELLHDIGEQLTAADLHVLDELTKIIYYGRHFNFGMSLAPLENSVYDILLTKLTSLKERLEEGVINDCLRLTHFIYDARLAIKMHEAENLCYYLSMGFFSDLKKVNGNQINDDNRNMIMKLLELASLLNINTEEFKKVIPVQNPSGDLSGAYHG